MLVGGGGDPDRPRVPDRPAYRRDLAAAVAAARRRARRVATVPWGVSRVVDQSITYHTKAPRLETVGQQFDKLATTLPSRDLPLLAAVLLASRSRHVATARPWRDPGCGRPRVRSAATRTCCSCSRGSIPLALLLVFEKNMWRPHIAALDAAARAARRAAAATASLVRRRARVPRAVVGGAPRRPALARAVPGAQAAAVAELRALPSGAWVISDEPGLAWRAGRRCPRRSSTARCCGSTSTWSPRPWSRDAARRSTRVCAVVVWTLALRPRPSRSARGPPRRRLRDRAPLRRDPRDVGQADPAAARRPDPIRTF